MTAANHSVTRHWAVVSTVVAVLMGTVFFTGCQLMPDSLKSFLGMNEPPTAVQSAPLEEQEAIAQQLFDKGIAAAEAGNQDKAIEAFEDVLTIFPKHVAANTNLGLAYANQKQWEKAQKAFDRVLAEEPDNPDANANQAWVLAEQELWPQALERGLKAVRIAPQNPYAFNTLGWIYAQTEQFDEAIGAYDTAVTLNPAMTDAWKAKGLLHCQLGQPESAKSALLKLTEGSEEHSALASAIGQGCVAP